MDLERILEVTDLARAGAGVAKEADGRVIFIPFTAPGDRVRVKLKKEGKRYAEAELIEIIRPSEIRQTPPCPVFGKCGGCQWQHLPYPLQWKTKVQGVLQSLERVHVLPPALGDFLPADQVWEYRNRVQIRGEGGQIGFFKSGTHELVTVDRCEIARPELNAVWKDLQEKALSHPEPFKVEIEVFPSGEVTQRWNERHSAQGFRQVHDAQNEKLKTWLAQALSRDRVLYDLYGGFGNLSLPLVTEMRQVHCVDLTVPENRTEAIPKNYSFHKASVPDWLRKAALPPKKFKPLKVTAASAILDPPREGLGSDFLGIASALESLGVRELVAVGCDPDAWARDISQWVRRGWRFERMALLDLFPQTAHIESIGLLRL